MCTIAASVAVYSSRIQNAHRLDVGDVCTVILSLSTLCLPLRFRQLLSPTITYMLYMYVNVRAPPIISAPWQIVLFESLKCTIYTAIYRNLTLSLLRLALVFVFLISDR